MARPKSIPLRLAEAEGDPDEHEEPLQEAAVKRKEDDGEHPAGDYAYVPDATKPSTWKLRIDDKVHVGAAAAALGPNPPHGKGVRIPAADRDKVKAKVRAAWRKFNPDASDDDMPAGIAEAVEKSLDQQSDDVRSAFRDQLKGQMADNPWAVGYGYYDCWVNEVYTDHVIARMGDDYWSIPYTLEADDDGDEEATFDFDKASKVERQWVTVEADGSEWLVRPISEAKGEEPSGSEWEVVIIATGESKNRRIYPEAVLKKAAPLFEGVRVLARSDEDHVSGTNKSVEKLVGWIDGVKYSKGAIRGIFHVSEAAAWLKTLLLDAWKRGKKDLVGLSIVAEGRGKPVKRDGKQFIEVEEITRVSSTDVVFDPAAGGGFLKLVAAEGEEESDVDPKLIAALKEAEAAVVRALLKGMAEADVEAIKKAHPELSEKIVEAMALPEPGKEEPTPDPKATKVAEAEGGDEGDDDEVVPASLSRMVVRSELAESKLPEIVRARIEKRFAGTSFKVEDLTEAIADAADDFAELEKAGLVQSAGLTREERIEVGISEAQRGMAALDGFFANKDQVVDGERVARYKSFRTAYVDLTGDESLTGRWAETSKDGRWPLAESENGTFKLPKLLDRRTLRGWSLAELREALASDGDGLPLIEAIQSTTFSNALGDSVTRAMVREYSSLNLDTWGPLVDIVPAKDFRTQRRERFGGYANLATVAQNAAYLAMTSPSDEEATYAITKRGGLETITIEAIANDDINMLRRIPLRMARAAAQTLHEFVFDFLRSNPNIYDGNALIRAGNNNIGSTALGVTSLAAARIRMRKQAQMGNSKRLGLVPKNLWIPIDLEQTAFELTQSEGRPDTADRATNYIRGTGISYTVVDYWSDANDWFVTADKSQTPLIELAFFGSETPELFEQNLPNVGDLFTNDRIVYKLRFIFGGAVLDFRGFDGSLVA